MGKAYEKERGKEVGNLMGWEAKALWQRSLSEGGKVALPRSFLAGSPLRVTL